MQALFLKRRVRREGAAGIDGIVRILVRVVVVVNNNEKEEFEKIKSE